jgi:hypothetical protein
MVLVVIKFQFPVPHDYCVDGAEVSGSSTASLVYISIQTAQQFFTFANTSFNTRRPLTFVHTEPR